MFRRNTFKFISILVILLLSFAGCNSRAKEIGGDNDESKEAISKSIDKDVKEVKEEKKQEVKEGKSGFLIGLSRDIETIEDGSNIYNTKPDEFRTLWITYDGNTIDYKERKGSIVTPYGDNFYEISNDLIELKEDSALTDTEDFYAKYNYFYSYSYVVSNMLGKSKKPLFTEENFKHKYSLGSDEWPFQTYAEWPWFIGNKYASIMTNYYETGGGTYRSGSDEIIVQDIASLGKVDGRGNTKKLYDLLDVKVKDELTKFVEKKQAELNSTGDNKGTQGVDLEYLSLIRGKGKWLIRIPIFEKYYHEGNGSNFNTVVDYIYFEGKLPASIISQDSLCIKWEEIEKAVPGAVDAFSSPNENLLIVMTENELFIFTNLEEGLDTAQKTIKLNEKERVILSQWATEKYVEKWDAKIGKYFN